MSDNDFERPIGPKRFAAMVGVTVRTLQRWDKKGLLVARRTPTDRRYYTMDQYREYLAKGNQDEESQESGEKKEESLVA